MRWIFMRDFRDGADSYRAGLCYQIPERLELELQINNIAYQEDQDPPLDPDTLDKLIDAETEEDQLAYRIAVRQREAKTRRKETRKKREAKLARRVKQRVGRTQGTGE